MEPESLPVTWFHSNDAAFWKKFKDNPGFVVIVPCAEGEEADFVKNDLALHEHIRIEEGVPVNVLSAGRAKGCEYPAVIVYGFGAAAETNLMSELDESEKTLDPDKSLPIQYFVNRLYVAVSRPKRRLVVVDTDQGFQKLWRCAQDEGVEEQMLESIKNGRSVWGQQIEGMNIGSPEDLSRESAGDPLENALAFEADGRARQDAFLLRQAAHAYRIAGDAAKSRECRARAFEAEGSWYEAGSAYFEAGFVVPEGVRCLWRSGKDGWTRLVDELPRNPQIQSELEYAWAQAIVNKPGVEATADLIKRFANALNDADFLEASLEDGVWRDALAALLQPITHSKEPAQEGDEVWARIVLALDRVRAKGLSVPSAQCAQIYFWAKRYDVAIALWGEAGETVSADYHKARAAVAPYPDRILSLAKIASHQEIIDSYLGAMDVQISSDQATAISDAFRENGRAHEAYAVALRYGLASAMVRLVRPALQEHDETAAKKALHSGLVLMVKQSQWDPVSKFGSSLEFVPSPEWRDKDLKALVQAETSALQITLVRALARSQELARAPQNVKQQLGSFLRKYLSSPWCKC
jgi:tetratricopeptide (TPR) repeat protein